MLQQFLADMQRSAHDSNSDVQSRMEALYRDYAVRHSIFPDQPVRLMYGTSVDESSSLTKRTYSYGFYVIAFSRSLADAALLTTNIDLTQVNACQLCSLHSIKKKLGNRFEFISKGDASPREVSIDPVRNKFIAFVNYLQAVPMILSLNRPVIDRTVIDQTEQLAEFKTLIAKAT